MNAMFLEVVDAKYISGYKILVTFNNGKSKLVDLEGKLHGPVFEPLRDLNSFKKFTVTFNTIEWPNGADLAPEYLYEIGELQYPGTFLAAEP